MKFIGLHGSSRESWVVGEALAAAHFAVVAAFIFFVARGSHDAQWELAFVPLSVLDLPVAILAYPLGFAVGWAMGALGLSRVFGVSLDPTLVIVAVANGVVGGAFYLILPPAISAHRRLKRETA